MKIEKVLKHGNRQAVQPPERGAYAHLMSVVEKFRGRFVRRQPNQQERKWPKEK